MMDILKNTFTQILEAYSQYVGFGVYMIFFYISIIVIYLRSSKNNASTLFFGYSLVVMAIIFNPIIGYVIIKYIEDYVYWRVFWTLPVTAAISYAAATVVSDISDKRKKGIVAIALIAIMIMGGKFIFTSENYSVGSNWYKLPSQTIELCEILESDCDGEIRVVAPSNFLVSIRQYDANIQMLYGRDGRVNTYDDTYTKRRNVYFLMQGNELNSKTISIYMYNLRCNYLVLSKTTQLSRNLDRYGFHYVASMDSYDIYRLNFDEQRASV